jgi:hypothetical protein
MKPLLAIVLLAFACAAFAADEKLKLEGANYKVDSVEFGPKVNITAKFDSPNKMASRVEKKIVIDLTSFAPELKDSKEAVEFVEKQLKGRYIKLLPMWRRNGASETIMRELDKPLANKRESEYYDPYIFYAIDIGGKRLDRLYDDWAKKQVELSKATVKAPATP